MKLAVILQLLVLPLLVLCAATEVLAYGMYVLYSSMGFSSHYSSVARMKYQMEFGECWD
jgi:hypothetical protein